jgi:O-acetyl-ADP-ribose deacetylase
MALDRISVIVGDITTQDVDAIVNAANTALAGGGGVDGAIHRAAGPELMSALRLYDGCPTGDCVATDAFRLRVRKIIHCVGPVWRGGGQNEDELLASCYRRALQLAAEYEVKTIAFPAISTGVYGFPKERATEIAVGTVRSEMPAFIRELRFVCYDEATAELYRRILERIGRQPR